MKLLLANFARMVNDSGGLAKVTCAFANAMLKSGHEVALLFYDEQEGDFFYFLDPRVKCYNLCRYEGKIIHYPMWMKLAREVLRPFSKSRSRDVNDRFMQRNFTPQVRDVLAMEKPDVIVASQPAASRILLCDIGTGIPVITMSHGDPEDYFHTYPKGEIPALGKSAACQVLLPGFADSIRSRFPDMRVMAIGNVVPQYREPANLLQEKEQYKIIFMGRLVKNHKRPHLLVQAFAQIAKDFPDWVVELWGADSSKSYKKYLKRLIHKNHLQERVFLKGTTTDAESVLRQGDIFVFPSAYEGFGMSLTEAMSMGLPVVACRDCLASCELIEHRRTGLLCDADQLEGDGSMAMMLSWLIKDRKLRCQMGTAARAAVKKYEADSIWSQWEALIRSVHQQA